MKEINNFSGDTNPFMPCLDSHGNYKRIYKIDVGNIPEEKIEDYVREIAQKFKAQPDLDCGIYPLDEYFLPVKNENEMNSVNYMQVVPNSHYWTDLNQILVSLDYYYDLSKVFHSEKRKNLPKEPNIYYGESEMSKEYLLIGINNAKKHGYKIKRFIEPEGGFIAPRFISIDQMIEWIETRNFNTIQDYQTFEDYIRNTLANGLNLTNGMKMNRQDVYKRLDGERDYQDAKWGTRRTADGTPDEEKPVAEWINYMEFHILKAKNMVYHLNTEEALAELRKVTALGVRAMEIHGCPARQIEAGDGTKPTEIDKPCCDGECDCKK